MHRDIHQRRSTKDTTWQEPQLMAGYAEAPTQSLLKPYSASNTKNIVLSPRDPLIASLKVSFWMLKCVGKCYILYSSSVQQY